MKIISKSIIVVLVLMLIFSNNIYAGMADYTDEQADKDLKQEQEEWKQKQEERINKSSNNYLEELTVDGYEITPEFDKQIINYEIVQEITDDYLEITAKTDDEKSSVSGVDKITLNLGENNLRIDVTAENGTIRTYFIKVVKSIKKNVRLNSFKLKTEDNNSIEITPEFDKDIFEYNCNVQSYIENVDVEAIANDENVKIEITGNKNLKEGLNEILITTSLDDEEKVVYKINVNKEKAIEVQEKANKVDNKIIVGIVIVIIILFFIIFCSRKIRKKDIKHKRKH